MTAVAGLALAEAWRLARTADVTGALTLDALKGTDVAFDPRIHAARPHPGPGRLRAQPAHAARAAAPSASRTATAARCRTPTACAACPRCTAPCATRSTSRPRTLAIEINAATDNPMVFAETGELLSGGNFHGEPVAMAADLLAIAVAELGGISERRTERLVNPALSGLPAFLTARGRAPVRPDARARDGRRPRLREQGPGPSRQRGLDPHLRQQGGPRLDGRDRGPQGGARGGQHAAHPGRRGASRPARPWSSCRPLATSPALQAAHARVRDARPRPTTATACSPRTSRRAAELVRAGALAARRRLASAVPWSR